MIYSQITRAASMPTCSENRNAAEGRGRGKMAPHVKLIKTEALSRVEAAEGIDATWVEQ